MNTIHNTPTDIFKFVNVRPPAMVSTDSVEKNFLKHPIERITDKRFWASRFIKEIEKLNGATLYAGLLIIPKNSPNYRSTVEDTVSKWSSPFRFESIEAAYEKYPGFREVANWVQVNRGKSKAPDSLEPVANAFLKNLYKVNGGQAGTDIKRDISFDLVDLQLRLWDNFIYQIVQTQNDNGQLRDAWMFLLRVAYFLEVYEAMKGSDVSLAPLHVMNKRLILPGLFPLPANINDNSNELTEHTASNTQKSAETLRKKVKGKQVFIGGSLISLDDLCDEQVAVDPCEFIQYKALPKGFGAVKMLGIGDLLVVKKQLIKYEAGEIAHIENVMGTEMRSRKLRKLEREEERTELERESETTEEREVNSSEKFSLEKESNELIKKDSSLEAGLTVTASYGMVNATSSVNYAQHQSQEESKNIASKISKEITNRAVSKISERIRELRSTLTIKEVEETNIHKFNNSGNDKHVTGIYQFVDKVYRAQVYNYGARTMVELIVPRPAAQYIYFKSRSSAEGSYLVKPIHPKDYTDNSDHDLTTPLKSYADVTEANYMKWGAVYESENIPPPPVSSYRIAKAYCYKLGGAMSSFEKVDLIDINPGYEAITAYFNFGFSQNISENRFVEGFLGDKHFHTIYYTDNEPLTISLNKAKEVIPFTINTTCGDLIMNLHIDCMRTQAAFELWKIEVYNTILKAYQEQLKAYNEKLAEMEFLKTNFGNNPNINRMIEGEEIKKGCIQLITDQYFDSFDSLQNNRGVNHYPEFDNVEARKEGEYIQFFEQAFEWTQMTYWFYPYFWGNKPLWSIIKQYEDNDPLFTKFLQAGAVRVMLPIRPGYENAIQHFLSTGQIWCGGETPVINDPLFLSIVDEIAEADGKTSAGPLEGSIPWEVKVPTNLVVLNGNGAADLPNYPVHKPFIIDTNHDHKDDYYPELAAPDVPGVEPEIYFWS